MNMSVYSSLSTQKELEKLLEVRAHNLSHAGTPGFLGRDSHIAGFKKSNFDSGVTYAHNSGFYTDMRGGNVQHTGDQYDVAVGGDNFLVVGTENNGTALTKSGHLTRDAEGVLKTANNYPVLDIGGGPITIPAEATQINIARDGLITTDQGPVGQLRVVRVENPARSLTHISGTLYLAEDENIVDEPTSMNLQQYFVTGSNIEPVKEVVEIMKIQQQYQKTMGVVGEVNKNNQDGTENLLSVPQNG